MTIHRNLNQAGNGGNYVSYYLKEILKDAGWKILDSGGGADSDPSPKFVAYRVSGTGDSIDGDSPDASHSTLDDSAGAFTAAMVGNYITVAGATNPNNNGTFEITAVNSATQLEYDNANGVDVTESFTYQIHGDHFTGVSIGVTSSPYFFGGSAPTAFDLTMGAGGCWWRAQDPAGNREILFNRYGTNGSNYDGYWCLSYSKAAGFTGGSPDYNTPPTATDEEQVSTVGTKASPGNMMQSNGLANLIHLAADDVASADGEYGFIYLEFITTNDLLSYGWLDDISNTATGDTHPLTIAHAALDLTYNSLYNDSSNTAKSFFDNGGGGEVWKGVEHLCPNGQAGIYPAAQGKVSKYDGKERPLLVPICDPTVGGYIGVSRWLNWTAVQRDYPNTGDSFNVLYVDDVVILDLWDGLTTPQAI